jgi:glycoside transferase family 2
MPAYKAEWLAQAVDSILAQTYPAIELIVVNDCSPHDLDSVMAQYTDPRVRYYRNEQNIGGKHLTRQWEHCLGFVRGEYLVMAADDDLYAPTFAEECMKLAMQHPSVDLIRTRVEEIDEVGALVGLESFYTKGLISQLEYIYAYRSGEVFICMGNFAFKTSVLREKGFVDFPRALGSDIATTIEMAANGVACVDQPLFASRHSTIHLSGSMAQLEPKMGAITLFYEWMERYPIPVPPNKYEVYYANKLTSLDWHEKCIYDYYNQVIRYVPMLKLSHFLSLARLASSKEKTKMIFRWCKDRVLSVKH